MDLEKRFDNIHSWTIKNIWLQRSVHRYERVSNILREAVSDLENSNRAKIVPIVKKKEQKTAVIY